MLLSGNTILITGGSSGIGRGLAEALHHLGNQVIIAGRNTSALDRVTEAHPGMRSVVLDVNSASDIQEVSGRITADFPELNILINNAGVQAPEEPLGIGDLGAVVSMIDTNLLGPMRLTGALLPHLQTQATATVINVTSTLAFVPLARLPFYSATKAALHSLTLSLRYQLRKSNVEVIELIPPYVQTNLSPGHGADPRAMPLGEFIAECMSLLTSEPNLREITVERAGSLRFASESGHFEEVFHSYNQLASPHET